MMARWPPWTRRALPLALLLTGAYLFNLFALSGVQRYLEGPAPVPTPTAPLISTPGCTIPGFPVDDPTVREFFKPLPTLDCGQEPPVTYVDDGAVVVDPAALRRRQGALQCCASDVTRRVWGGGGELPPLDVDAGYRLSPCTPFSTRYTTAHEGVLVKCHRKDSILGLPVYTNVHYLFPREKVKDKIDAFKAKGGWSKNPETPNVIIFGTDSVSRLNVERHMPKTLKRIKSISDSLDFAGYNKVADNTDPNLVALLLGIHPFVMDSLPCHNNPLKAYDDCPFIWKEFSQRGYVTAYLEDSPIMSLFHYEKPGYINPPTDFYGRAAYTASDDNIGRSEGPYSYYFKNCQGATPAIKVLHDYALDGLDAFRDVPFFGFFWSSSSSHERINDISTVDEYHANFIDQLDRRGHLNNTVVLLMSDHGLRFGKIRSTYIGSLEERLPYMFLLLPPWLRAAHSRRFDALRANTRRLVTNFDFHVTLRQILRGKIAEEGFTLSNDFHRDATGRLVKAKGRVPKRDGITDRDTSAIQALADRGLSLGRSLFSPLPLNRTCAMMGIPDHFCTCASSSPLPPSSPEATQAARVAVASLNAATQAFPLCARWRLGAVVQAQVKGPAVSSSSVEGLTVAEGQTLTVAFSALPGSALFEATLGRAPQGYTLRGEVSRISRYDAYGSPDEGVNVEVKLGCIDKYTKTASFLPVRKYCQCQ